MSSFPRLRVCPARVSLALLGLGVLLARPGHSQRLPAFPGAEGAGKYTTGGRGSAAAPTTVFEVTSLSDAAGAATTPGTLRYALTQTAAARTIVFRVCGTIRLTSKLAINKANTTLAGQTAPGQGICLADYPVVVSANNVIVRFVRFRMGDRFQNIGMVDGAGSDDAFGGRFITNTIVDHCTMSWSTDEACSFYQSDSLTLQWNLISEPLDYSYHFEAGDTDFEHHGYGGIWGGRRASFHHNLFAHCKGRNPRFSGSGGYTPAAVGTENGDFQNNVVYNWGSYSTNGGEGGNYNVVNNYYRYGPSTNTGNSSGVPVRSMIMNPSKSTALPYPKVYMRGNYVDGYPAVTNRNWLGVVMAGGTRADTALARVTTAFPLIPIPTQSAQDAYAAVLQNAGCVLPQRDTLDQRIINNVLTRTGRIIDVQGGYPHGTPYSTSQSAWPVLTGAAASLDTDHDGMPDAWEVQNGLNPANAADRQNLAANGYTNLENYLNGIAAVVMGTQDSPKTAVTLQAYPNPAADQLTLTHPASSRPAILTLYTADGRRVATVVTSPDRTDTPLSLRGLPRGLYLLRYFGADGQQLTTRVLHD